MCTDSAKRAYSTFANGNIRKDIGSPHYRAHESLEKFWDKYRKNGEFYRDLPTLTDYNQALKNSLVDAGLSVQQSEQVLQKAVEQQVLYGLKADNFVPRVPRKIYLPKLRK